MQEPKTLLEVFQKFPTDKEAREHYEQLRWKGNPTCPFCDTDKPYKLGDGKKYKCRNSKCYKKFSVTYGTIFQDSNIPLNKWFAAIFLATSHKKGISSVQLGKDIGVAQKTGWFMMCRIREMLKEKAPKKLVNEVQADETGVGGYLKNRHKFEREQMEGKSKVGDKAPKKPTVMGMLETDGNVIAKHIAHADGVTLKPILRANIDKDAILVTDTFGGYYGMHKEFKAHVTLNHKQNEYVRGGFHTNSIENFWSCLKRTIYGTYHWASEKHLQRYVDESAFRYNTRKCAEGERFNLALSQSGGKLPYKILVHGKEETK